MIDKIKKALLTVAALAALGFGAKAVKANDVNNVLNENEEKKVLKTNSRGHISLDSIFWPDGSGIEARVRINGDEERVPFGLYVSGEEARRGDVGYDKVFGRAEVVLGNDRLKIMPFIVGESTSFFGDSLLKRKSLGGIGGRIDVDIPGLSIDGVLFKEWGSYKMDGAEGKDSAERLLYGLRGNLGKRKWRLIFSFKRDEKEYRHLGNIVKTDFSGGIQYRGRRVLIELLGGNEKIKYNPGNEFQTNYVEARVLVRLGKNCCLKVEGQYNFNGADRLSESPIPKYEVGVGFVIPFGYGTKPKGRNHNPYLPRSKLGRR